MNERKLNYFLPDLSEDQFEQWVQLLRQKQAKQRKEKKEKYTEAIIATRRHLNSAIARRRHKLQQFRLLTIDAYSERIIAGEKEFRRTYEMCQREQHKLQKEFVRQRFLLQRWESYFHKSNKVYTGQQQRLRYQEEKEWKHFEYWARSKLAKVKSICAALTEDKENSIKISTLLQTMLIDINRQ